MGRPVVFLAFANEQNDSSAYLRDLPEEARRLRETLERAQAADLCELVLRTNATADEIFDVFQDYADRIAVFHFAGHADGYSLLVEGASGRASKLQAASFSGFLSQRSNLQLVFLNGCSTAPQVQGLLSAGVRAVVATSQDIDDRMATEFAARFYRGLASGADIRTAFGQASHAAESKSAGERARPWRLELAEDSEPIGEWSLREASRNPLFGLPRPRSFDLPASPYRHLLWFKPEHWEIFFGRDTEIRDLYRAVTAHDGAPVILFYGQSGVGKSSLLEAGLVPRLEPRMQVVQVRREPELGLVGALRGALAASSSDDIRASWLARSAQGFGPLVLILDQLEEAYTRPRAGEPDEVESFVSAVSALFASREGRPAGKLVLGFRKEWLAEIRARLGKADVPFEEHFIEPLSQQGMLEVIRGPLRNERLRRKYRLEIADGLDDRIVAELAESRGSPVAPVLQILLTDLWQAAANNGRAAPRFDETLYDPLQRQGLSLQRFLVRQMEALQKLHPDAVDSGLLLDILFAHTTSLGTADQRTFSELSRAYPLRKDLAELLRALQDHYLLTDVRSGRDGEEACTRLMHDTLAPIVRHAYETSARPGQRAQRILSNRVSEWRNGTDGPPLDQVDLPLVENGRQGMRLWDADELRLVQASRRVERNRKIKRQALIVSAWVTAAIMAGLAILLSVQNFSLKQERERAENFNDEVKTRALAAARSAFNFNLSNEAGLTGVSSDVAAQRLRDGVRFENRFRRFSWGWLQRQYDYRVATFDLSSPQLRSGDDDFFESEYPQVLDAYFAPDSHSLVISGESPVGSGKWLWKSGSAGLQSLKPTRTLELNGVHRLSADGRLAVARRDSTSGQPGIVVLEVQTGKRTELHGFGSIDVAFAISPDGETVAAADGGKLVLWSWRTGSSTVVRTGRCWNLAFSRDGTTLACRSESDVSAFNAKTGALLGSRRTGARVPAGGEGEDGSRSSLELDLDPRIYLTRTNASNVAIHPDGEWIAFVTYSQVHLWNWKTGMRRTRPGLTDVSAVALSKSSLAVARGDTIEWRDFQNMNVMATFTADSPASILRFSDDGQLLLAASTAGKLGVWSLHGRTSAEEFDVGANVAVHVSNDGATAYGIRVAGKTLESFSVNLVSGEQTLLKPGLMDAPLDYKGNVDSSKVTASVDANGGGALLRDSYRSQGLLRWDATGVVRPVGKVEASESYALIGGVLSEGGRYVATQEPENLTMREGATGATLWSRKIEAILFTWSPDQTELAYLTSRGELNVVEMATGEEIATGLVPSNVSLEDIGSHVTDGHSLAYGENAKALVLAVNGARGAQSSVFRVDRKTFDFNLILDSEKKVLRALLTHDGDELITLDEEGVVAMWDARNGQRRAQYQSKLKPHDRAGLWLSSDGLRVTASDDAGTIVTLQASPSLASWFPEIGSKMLDAKSVFARPDGTVVIDSYPYARRVSIDGGVSEEEAEPDLPVSYSRKDHDVIWAALLRSEIGTEPSVLEEVGALIDRVPEIATALVAWDSGKAIAVQLAGEVFEDGTTKVLRKNEPDWEVQGSTAFAVSADGKRLATAGSARMAIWDLDQAPQVPLLQGEGLQAGTLQFSADRRYILVLAQALTTSAPRGLEVYDASTLKAVFEGVCIDATFSGDGHRLLIAMNERTFSVLTGTWEVGPTLTRHRTPIRSMVYSAARGELISLDANDELQVARIR